MKNKSKKIIVLFLSVLLIFISTIGNSNVANATTTALNKTKATVYVGNTYTLKVTGTTKTVTWESSNKSIATVNAKGVITGVKNGSVTISATVSGKNYKCSVTVINPYITPTNVSINVGKTTILSLKGASSKATVKWSSSDESIATINSYGVVKGVAEGTVSITAAVGKKTYTRNITVKNVNVTTYSKTYTGNGDKVLSGLSLPKDTYSITLSHDGDRNFIVYSYINGKKDSLLANEIGACTLETVLNNGKTLDSNNLMLEIQADGNWTIKIESISSQSTINVTGTGKCVSGTFKSSNDITSVVTLKYDGERNFIVYLKSTDGTSSLLANEIGNYSGEKIITLSKNKTYYWTVYSYGDFSINVNGEYTSTDITPQDISLQDTTNTNNKSSTDDENDLSNWTLATDDQINADVSVDYITSYSTVFVATFLNNNNYNMEINPTASIVTNNVVYSLVPIDSDGNIITTNTIVTPNQSVEIYFATVNHKNFYINKTSDIIFDLDYNSTHYKSIINNSSGVQFLYNK